MVGRRTCTPPPVLPLVPSESIKLSPALPLASPCPSHIDVFKRTSDGFRAAVLGSSPASQEQFIQAIQPKELWSSLTLLGIDSRGWGKNRKAALGLEKAGTEK